MHSVLASARSLRRSFIPLSLAVAGALLAAAALPAAPAPAPDSVNLLANPGFEAPFEKQCCQPAGEYPPGTPIDEVQVAAGWLGWWRAPAYPVYPPSCGEARSPQNNCVAFHRPEWREAAPYRERIRSGGNAQKYFTFWSVHEAGMLQVVHGVQPGQRLRFTVYMQAWSAADDRLTSAGQQTMNLKVGLDPTGGTDPFGPNVVWGQPGDSYDAFAPFSVEVTARATRVTVFTYSRPVYPLKHNDVYLDDASLTVPGTGSPGGGAAPAGTPPRPTRTPTPTIPTVEYVVRPGDNLSKIARQFSTTADALIALNRLSTTVIQPGQVLRVPAP